MKNSRRRWTGLPAVVVAGIAAIIPMAGCSTPPIPEVLFVRADAPAGGDGRAWTTAYTDLQDALGLARSNDGVREIWVAGGTYRPAGADGDRTATFQLVDGVSLYGGFDGTETNRDARDVETNTTILSGDLNSDDDGVAGNNENAYHVVTTGAAGVGTTLDGFIIEGGHADSESNPNGGGLFNAGGSPTLINCTFRNNVALSSGGGAMNFNGKLTLTDCRFEQNSAIADGGALANLTGRGKITGCTFTDNSAGGSGGALFNSSSSPTLDACTFETNSANEGGALSNSSGSSPVLTDCVFVENTVGTDGGAVANVVDSEAMFVRCTFRDNQAGRSGGAVLNSVNANTVWINCVFQANASLVSGGAMFSFSSSVAMTNCLLTGNSSASGGALLNRDGSDATIVNCTIAQNSATLGGGIANTLTSSPQITNCILWGNTQLGQMTSTAQIYTESGGPVVNHSCVEGGWAGAGAEGVISEDPLFVDALGPDETAGTGDEDFHLLTSSPCIDTGDNDAIPADLADLDADDDPTEPTPVDLDGAARIQPGPTSDSTNDSIDIGAYEQKKGSGVVSD